LAVELLGLGALTLVSGGLVAGSVLGALSHGHHLADGLLLLPPVALGAVGWGTLRRMRALNRQALAGPDTPPVLGAGGA
jgi:hypothetical protein